MATRRRQTPQESAEEAKVTTATLTEARSEPGCNENPPNASAANAPGIAQLDNRIIVQSFHDSKMDDWDEIY